MKEGEGISQRTCICTSLRHREGCAGAGRRLAKGAVSEENGNVCNSVNNKSKEKILLEEYKTSRYSIEN